MHRFMYVQVFHLFYERISISVVIFIMKFYFYIPVYSINSVIYESKMFHYYVYKTICTKYIQYFQINLLNTELAKKNLEI